MSEGSSHTSLSPNSTRHTNYQNLQQQCKMANSSRGWSGSTSRGWVQCSRFHTKTQVKVVAEEPSCSCKPMSSSLSSSSSAMKDKDKRHFFLLGEPLASGIFSFKRRQQQQQQTTNGSSCANNCPTSRLKYLCPSISFFFTFFSLSCPSCHYSLRKSNSSSGSTWTERKRRGMKWSHKYIASSVSVPLLLLLILAEIITVSVGTPITTPTQKHNGAAFQTHRKYEEKLDYVDYQRNTNTNHSVFRDNNENDSSDRMFDSRSSRGGDWDHVDDNDVYSNSGTDTISSSLLKFGFSSEQDSPPNHHNNKFESGEEKMASHLQGNHEAVMMMPIPFMKSQKLSSHPEDQQQPSETLARVTNDTLFSGENISNNNNGDGAFLSKSKNKKNNNKNNNIDDDGSTTNGSIKTTGKCWSVVLFEGKTETPTSSPSLGFGAFAEPLKKPISILCNGTNQLEATLDQIPENLVSQVISIDVKDSSISRLNLTLFHRFPRLESLSVTHSNVTHVIGTCPSGLKALNISFNVLRKVDSSVFLVSETKRDNYEEGELTDAHYGDNGETNFSSKSVSSFTSTSFPSPSSSTAVTTFSSRSKSDSLQSPPAKISLPSRFNAAHNPESSSAPITSPSSKQMRESRSFETKHGDSAGNEGILKRKSKTSSSSSELIEAAENTNESNDNDGLTLQDIYSSKRSRDIKNKDETMTFSSIRTTHLATASASDSSSSDSEKSESYSYEEEGNEGGDYYQRGSSAHIATTTMAGNTKNWRKDNKGNEIQDTSTSSDGVTQIRRLKGSALQDIDLSHNKISEIPSVILDLQGLKSLRLSGNQLKCDFVWEILADWYMKSEDPNILKDGDETSCGVVDDVRVFHYTVLGVLKAKKDVVETCRTVDKSICHDCSLYSLNKHAGNGYNLSHQSAHGNVAIALKLDCSFQNLTDLPEVPPQTWQLNVSGNLIKDLSSLKEPMYENLLILDADSNEITTLDGLAGTSFLDRYNYLSLQNNRFPVIPSNVLSSLKNMRGQGVTFLGANFLECDCDVVKEIKPLLLENSKQIKDLKEIYCKDMKTQSGESYVAVKDLQYTDLCYMDTEESNEMYLYILITVEIILILVIVAKVWHDQRTFRRTGILPWCSAKMPRLPCDAILESVKEPPHFNRSSSTNVRSFACEPPSQSLSSHVQLREVRSNSGQSEKSSQISQLSSFPSSSRTSSV